MFLSQFSQSSLGANSTADGYMCQQLLLALYIYSHSKGWVTVKENIYLLAEDTGAE